jgi:hypothetical protein
VIQEQYQWGNVRKMKALDKVVSNRDLEYVYLGVSFTPNYFKGLKDKAIFSFSYVAVDSL